MSDRYTKLFSLPLNLYAPGTPVVIAAGALLKDNQTGNVLAQLKMQSITDKTIKAVKVQIALYDTIGNPLDETVYQEYLDLAVTRDETFGQQTPVFLPNASARGYAVRVTYVVFTDNTVWHDNGAEWKPLTAQSKLSDKVKDAELVKQYQLTFGPNSLYIPSKERDLWLCTCGYINHDEESECHKCQCTLEGLRTVDFTVLQKEMRMRIEKETRHAEEKEKAARKKALIAASIAVPLVISLIIFASWYTSYNRKKNIYNNALSLAEAGNAKQAIELLEYIDDFKDSSRQIKQIKYQLANSLYDNEEYDNAIELFKSLGDYEDSAKQIQTIESQKFENEVKSLMADYFDNYVDVYDNLVNVKTMIEEFDGEISDGTKRIYDSIKISMPYYGIWKVVSGDINLGFDSIYASLRTREEIDSFGIFLDYDSKKGEVYLKLFPFFEGKNLYYPSGGSFVLDAESSEPFTSATVNGQNAKEYTYKLSDISINKRIVIRAYKDGEVDNKLTLEWQNT